MKVHKNIKEAREACNKYVIELEELKEKEGILEECDDCCCCVYYSAKYYDEESGTIKTYFHN
jgi:hypothetical protein